MNIPSAPEAAAKEAAHCPAADAINERLQALCDDQRDPEIEDNYRLHRRFDRIGRLIGDHNMARLLGSKVIVVGLGGVGSFAAESLVRSGVGHVVLVDFDKVCITNSNRQLQAMKGTIGKYKSEILGDRLRLINPQAVVEVVTEFYSEQNADDILGAGADWVVDAIDNVSAKCHLLAECRARSLKVICSTGASGRMDPTQIKVKDLAKSQIDPLAHAVRKLLRKRHGFGTEATWGIPAVFSTERPIEPVDLHYDGGHGFRCVCPGGNNPYHGCDDRNRIWGTAGFVTGAFGLTCASIIVRAIIESTPASEG